MRWDEWSEFREGITIDPRAQGHGYGRGGDDESEHTGGRGSIADAGLAKPVALDAPLQPGVRVTVRLHESMKAIADAGRDAAAVASAGRREHGGAGRGLTTLVGGGAAAAPRQRRNQRGRLEGEAVGPATPRESSGLYWGYQVRMATSLAHVFAECPHKGGYDFTVGTSERGVDMDDEGEGGKGGASLPAFRHMLVVLGGVRGLEEAVEADEALQFAASDPGSLFDLWLNVCPG